MFVYINESTNIMLIKMNRKKGALRKNLLLRSLIRFAIYNFLSTKAIFEISYEVYPA